jgi:Fe-S-cluster containining protein
MDNNEINNNEKFRCLRCGSCCCPKIEPDKTRYIPIYLDELEVILQKSRDLQKSIKLRPDLVYADRLNSQLIETTFELIVYDECEFYNTDSKSCIIYQDRPLTCKAFPVLTWRPDGHRKYLQINSKCKFVSQNIWLYDCSYSELETFFPNEYKYAKDLMDTGREILHKILQLESDGIIDIGFLRNNREIFGLNVNINNKSFKNWKRIKLSEIEIE